jgi:hypothetical protein
MLENNEETKNMEIVSGGVMQGYAKQFSILFIGLIFGALAAILLINSDVEILYISQDELIDLEKSRVEQMANRKGVELFNGQVERSIGLIENIAKSYESNSSKVVFSRGSVNGNNVSSISKEVHTKLLEELTNISKELK